MSWCYVWPLRGQEHVRPWVAPSFHLLRAVLETLPRPKLTTDEQIMEKVEL